MSKREPKWYREKKEIDKIAFDYAEFKTVDLTLEWIPLKMRAELGEKLNRDDTRELRRRFDRMFSAWALATEEGYEIARKMFVLRRLRKAWIKAGEKKR